MLVGWRPDLLQHVVSYSISAGSIVNVVAMVSQPHLYGTTFTGQWVTDCSPSEVQECYRSWEPEVEEMVKVNQAFPYYVQSHMTGQSSV